MSEQDDFAIIGRLTKSAAEGRKRAAFLRQEMEMVQKDVQDLAGSLINRSREGRTLYTKLEYRGVRG